MFNRPGDLYYVIGIIVAFGGLALAPQFSGELTTLFGAAVAAKVVAGIQLVSGLAGAIGTVIRVQANPSPPVGQASIVTAVEKGVATLTVRNPGGQPNK